jgi:cyclic beta-1,2-glucan synthetase
LVDGPLQGYPRVFGIAWAIVAHTDSAFDVQKLTRFVEAYQRVQPLTIGELWAIAITLRITLVENLRRLAEQIVARLSAGQLADMRWPTGYWARTRPIPNRRSKILQSLDQAPWSTAFAVQLAQRLRDRDPNVTPALRWLNDKLAAREHDNRRDRARRSAAPERDERHRPQRDHEHASRVDGELGGVLRKRQPCRRDPAERQRFRGDGFSHARSLPPRDRRPGAQGSELDETEVARRVVAAAKRAQRGPAKARVPARDRIPAII